MDGFAQTPQAPAAAVEQRQPGLQGAEIPGHAVAEAFAEAVEALLAPAVAVVCRRRPRDAGSGSATRRRFPTEPARPPGNRQGLRRAGRNCTPGRRNDRAPRPHPARGRPGAGSYRRPPRGRVRSVPARRRCRRIRRPRRPAPGTASPRRSRYPAGAAARAGAAPGESRRRWPGGGFPGVLAHGAGPGLGIAAPAALEPSAALHGVSAGVRGSGGRGRGRRA